MRTFFVILVSCWLLGLVLGAREVPWLIVAVTSSIVVFGIIRLKFSIAFTAAGLSVLLLATLYGQTAAESLSETCSVTAPTNVTLIERPEVRTTMVRYRVRTEHNCDVLITASRFPVFSQGTKLQAAGGTVESLAEFPAEYAGYARYLSRQGIHATWRYPNLTALEKETNETSMYERTQHRIYALFREPEAGLLAALLIGDDNTIATHIQDVFRVTGTTHVISISGLHISAIAGFLLLLFLTLPLRPRPRTALMLIVLFSYVLFIGAPVAALRAVFFWTLALIGIRLRALVSLPTILLLTTVVVLTHTPLLIFDISFQLSFSAVAGIFLAIFLWQRQLRKLPDWSRAVASVTLVSIGATLTTWPLVAYHFGNVSLVSPIANIFIVPLSTAILLLGALTLAVSFISPLAATLLAYGVHLLVSVTTGIATLLSRIPYAALEDVIIPPWLITLYYIGIALLAIVWLKVHHRSWREVWQ
ncbi:MAG: ComEC/Rec2 family competence protein [Candidatus Andersenbacteria bacterium]